MNNKHAVQDR